MAKRLVDGGRFIFVYLDDSPGGARSNGSAAIAYFAFLKIYLGDDH